MMAMTQRSSILWQEKGDGPSGLAGHVGGAFDRKARGRGYSHAPRGGGDDGDVLSLHGDGPGDVEVGGQLPHHHVPGDTLHC